MVDALCKPCTRFHGLCSLSTSCLKNSSKLCLRLTYPKKLTEGLVKKNDATREMTWIFTLETLRPCLDTIPAAPAYRLYFFS